MPVRGQVPCLNIYRFHDLGKPENSVTILFSLWNHYFGYFPKHLFLDCEKQYSLFIMLRKFSMMLRTYQDVIIASTHVTCHRQRHQNTHAVGSALRSPHVHLVGIHKCPRRSVKGSHVAVQDDTGNSEITPPFRDIDNRFQGGTNQSHRLCMRHWKMKTSLGQKTRRFRYEGTQTTWTRSERMPSFDVLVHRFWWWSFHTRSNTPVVFVEKPRDEFRARSQTHLKVVTLTWNRSTHRLRCHATEFLCSSWINKAQQRWCRDLWRFLDRWSVRRNWCVPWTHTYASAKKQPWEKLRS